MIAGPSLQALVPHAGSMCLLDAVESWDEAGIVCRSASHRREDHPLRRDGGLSCVHLVEYAAQATAVHGSLLAGARGVSMKYLGAVRDCDFHVQSLEGIVDELRIEARRQMVMGENVLYRFRVAADGRLLAEGRLSVVAPDGTGT